MSGWKEPFPDELLHVEYIGEEDEIGPLKILKGDKGFVLKSEWDDPKKQEEYLRDNWKLVE